MPAIVHALESPGGRQPRETAHRERQIAPPPLPKDAVPGEFLTLSRRSFSGVCCYNRLRPLKQHTAHGCRLDPLLDRGDVSTCRRNPERPLLENVSKRVQRVLAQNSTIPTLHDGLNNRKLPFLCGLA